MPRYSAEFNKEFVYRTSQGSRRFLAVFFGVGPSRQSVRMTLLWGFPLRIFQSTLRWAHIE